MKGDEEEDEGPGKKKRKLDAKMEGTGGKPYGKAHGKIHGKRRKK